MKRYIFILVVLALIAVLLSGCNNRTLNVHSQFDEAIIRTPDGSIVRGQVQEWSRFYSPDFVQVKIDGVTYQTNSLNVLMIAKDASNENHQE